jgi:hypothetical protein
MAAVNQARAWRALTLELLTAVDRCFVSADRARYLKLGTSVSHIRHRAKVLDLKSDPRQEPQPFRFWLLDDEAIEGPQHHVRSYPQRGIG